MQYWLGVFCALASAALYAGAVNIVPLAQAAGGSTLFYLAMRGTFNFCLTFAPSPNSGGILSFSPQPKHLLFLGGCVALQGYGYVQALHLLPISIATPLFFLFPIFTYLLHNVLKSQGLRLIPIVSLGASSIGVWLLAQGGDNPNETAHLLGIFWALSAAMAQAAVNLVLPRISGLDSWQLLRASYLPSFLIFAGYSLSQPLPEFTAWAWTATSAAIFFIGSVLFLRAIRLLGAVRTSNVMYFEPVLSVLLSVLLHQDQLSIGKISAIVLILGATIMLEKSSQQAQSP